MPSVIDRKPRTRKSTKIAEPAVIKELVAILAKLENGQAVKLDTEHETKGKAAAESARYRTALLAGGLKVRATMIENENGTFSGGIYKAL